MNKTIMYLKLLMTLQNQNSRKPVLQKKDKNSMLHIRINNRTQIDIILKFLSGEIISTIVHWFESLRVTNLFQFKLLGQKCYHQGNDRFFLSDSFMASHKYEPLRKGCIATFGILKWLDFLLVPAYIIQS